MALTEDQKKNIVGYRPKAIPASPKTLAARRTGREAVPMGRAGKDIQAGLHGVSEIAGSFNRRMVDPITAPFKSAFGAVGEVAGGVKGAHETQKRRMATMQKYGSGATGRFETGREHDQPSRLPTGAMSPFPQDVAGGATVAEAEQLPQIQEDSQLGVDVGTEGASTGTDVPHITAGDWRGNYKYKMGAPEQIGAYEVSNLNQTPEAMERFGRQPTRPPQQRVSAGHPLFRGGRPEGGWSPDYQKSWNQQKEGGIAPPRSIGDMFRYKREVQERDRMMGYADKSRRTDIMESEAGKRTGIARMKAESDIGRQSSDDARQREFDDPNTTPERRKELGRSMAFRRGKTMTPGEPRKGVFVEAWNEETGRMEQVLKDPYLDGNNSGKRTFTKPNDKVKERMRGFMKDPEANKEAIAEYNRLFGTWNG